MYESYESRLIFLMQSYNRNRQNQNNFSEKAKSYSGEPTDLRQNM